MKKKLVFLAGSIMGFAPIVALAQVDTSGATSKNCDLGNNGTIFGILCQVGRFLNAIVPVLIALAVVWFVWGVITFVINDDEEAKEKGRNRIIFGIIGLAVIVGLWGLVNLLRNTFDLNNTTDIELPTVPVIIED